MENLDHILSVTLIVLGVASAAVPLARKVASLTANKTDDEAVEAFANVVDKLLSWIPTISVKPKR